MTKPSNQEKQITEQRLGKMRSEGNAQLISTVWLAVYCVRGLDFSFSWLGT